MLNKNEIYAWCDSCGAPLNRNEVIHHRCDYGTHFCKDCFIQNKIFVMKTIEETVKDSFTVSEDETGTLFIPKSATTKREMDLVHLTEFICKRTHAEPAGGLLGGEFGYGTDFENDAFIMHPFCWCDADGCRWCKEDAPNFIHKKSELRIHWYKWIGREMRYSQELSDIEWRDMIEECMESVK